MLVFIFSTANYRRRKPSKLFIDRNYRIAYYAKLHCIHYAQTLKTLCERKKQPQRDVSDLQRPYIEIAGDQMGMLKLKADIKSLITNII